MNLLRINDKQQQNQEEKNEIVCHICQKENHDTQNCFYNYRNSSQKTFIHRNTRFNGPRFQTKNYRNYPRFANNTPRKFSQWPHTTQHNHVQNFMPSFNPAYRLLHPQVPDSKNGSEI